MSMLPWNIVGGAKCCCCSLAMRSLTATLSHHGFSSFACDGVPDPSTSRWLTLTQHGPGFLSGCETGSIGKSNINQVYNIDPFTGLSCLTGDDESMVNAMCGAGTPTTCSSSSKYWDCGNFTEGEKSSICLPSDTALKKEWTETLSNNYTIDDVGGNVDTMLGRINMDTQLPPGTYGTVVNGTGHSIATWSPGATNRAGYWKTGGTITKTKVTVDIPGSFLENFSYKLTTTPKDGVATVQDLTAAPGTTVTIEPPATEGTVEFSPWCGTVHYPTTLTQTTTGTYTTKTYSPKDEFGDPVPCNITHTAPDCQEYLTMTVESNGSSASDNPDWIPAEVLPGEEPHTWTKTHSSAYTTAKTVYSGCEDDKYSGKDGSEWMIYWKENYEEDPSVFYYYAYGTKLEQDYATGVITGWDGTEDGWGDPFYPTTVGPTPPSCNQGHSCSETIGDTTITVTVGKTSKTIQTDTPGEFGDSNCTYTVSWSTEDPDDGDPEGNWDTETCELGEQGCISFSGCVSNYSSVTATHKSEASIQTSSVFAIPTTVDATTYRHYLHYYTAKEDTSDAGCTIRTVVDYTSFQDLEGTTGSLTATDSISLPTPSKNQIVCIHGPIAYVIKP